MAYYYVSQPPGAYEWKEAMDLYYQDKVEAALRLVQPVAGAFDGVALREYRIFEGEALTRHSSSLSALSPWLQLEWVQDEVPHSEAVGNVVLEAASAVARRLQWDKREATLATILVSEADANWNDARYGYCVDKVPYDKICLPHVSSRDPDELERVTSHEFAHVVILNTAQNFAPHWLDEGIACLMEGRSAAHAAERLRQSPLRWRDRHHVNDAFGADRRDAANAEGVGAAYDQAMVLVAYLHSLGGDEGLVNLLNALPDHSHLADVVMKFVSGDPVDVSLHRVYGFGHDELFEKAGAWSGAA